MFFAGQGLNKRDGKQKCITKKLAEFHNQFALFILDLWDIHFMSKENPTQILPWQILYIVRFGFIICELRELPVIC